MYWFLVSLFILMNTSIWSQEIESSEQLDREDVQWIKQKLKEQKESFSIFKQEAAKALNLSTKENCHSCLVGKAQVNEAPLLMVFMSFAVPNQVWLSLSQSLEKVGGVFVLRGIPNNSFMDLAKKVLELKKIGVNAEIQLNPKLFEKYQVSQVPCFVVSHAENFDKVTGNISLDYALTVLADKGETGIAKHLKEKLTGALK